MTKMINNTTFKFQLAKPNTFPPIFFTFFPLEPNKHRKQRMLGEWFLHGLGDSVSSSSSSGPSSDFFCDDGLLPLGSPEVVEDFPPPSWVSFFCLTILASSRISSREEG